MNLCSTVFSMDFSLLPQARLQSKKYLISVMYFKIFRNVVIYRNNQQGESDCVSLSYVFHGFYYNSVKTQFW